MNRKEKKTINFPVRRQQRIKVRNKASNQSNDTTKATFQEVYDQVSNEIEQQSYIKEEGGNVFENASQEDTTTNSGGLSKWLITIAFIALAAAVGYQQTVINELKEKVEDFPPIAYVDFNKIALQIFNTSEATQEEALFQVKERLDKLRDNGYLIFGPMGIYAAPQAVQIDPNLLLEGIDLTSVKQPEPSKNLTEQLNNQFSNIGNTNPNPANPTQQGFQQGQGMMPSNPQQAMPARQPSPTLSFPMNNPK